MNDITMIAALAALALTFPALAQQPQYPMPPGIQALAKSMLALMGTVPMAQLVRRRIPMNVFRSTKRFMGSGHFSFAGTAPTTIAAFRRTSTLASLKAVYAAADVTKQGGYYALNVALLRLLEGMMQGPDAAGRNQDTVK